MTPEFEKVRAAEQIRQALKFMRNFMENDILSQSDKVFGRSQWHPWIVRISWEHWWRTLRADGYARPISPEKLVQELTLLTGRTLDKGNLSHYRNEAVKKIINYLEEYHADSQELQEGFCYLLKMMQVCFGFRRFEQIHRLWQEVTDR